MWSSAFEVLKGKVLGGVFRKEFEVNHFWGFPKG